MEILLDGVLGVGIEFFQKFHVSGGEILLPDGQSCDDSVHRDGVRAAGTGVLLIDGVIGIGSHQLFQGAVLGLLGIDPSQRVLHRHGGVSGPDIVPVGTCVENGAIFPVKGVLEGLLHGAVVNRLDDGHVGGLEDGLGGDVLFQRPGLVHAAIVGGDGGAVVGDGTVAGVIHPVCTNGVPALGRGQNPVGAVPVALGPGDLHPARFVFHVQRGAGVCGIGNGNGRSTADVGNDPGGFGLLGILAGAADHPAVPLIQQQVSAGLDVADVVGIPAGHGDHIKGGGLFVRLTHAVGRDIAQGTILQDGEDLVRVFIPAALNLHPGVLGGGRGGLGARNDHGVYRPRIHAFCREGDEFRADGLLKGPFCPAQLVLADGGRDGLGGAVAEGQGCVEGLAQRSGQPIEEDGLELHGLVEV